MVESMILAAKRQIADMTRAAYAQSVAAGLLPAGVEVTETIEIPKDPRNGDYASSFAMAGAKAFHMAPRAIAQILQEHMVLEGSYFDKVEVAGPGFLNFTLGTSWFEGVLSGIEAAGDQYGRCDVGRGNK